MRSFPSNYSMHERAFVPQSYVPPANIVRRDSGWIVRVAYIKVILLQRY